MTPGNHELDLWLAQQAHSCRLCPRSCAVDRAAGEHGWCGAGLVPQWYRAFVHHGEEPELAPSLTVYLSGCNLGCVFCHTAPERQVAQARPLTAAALAEIAANGRDQGARNLNLLGGEPLVNLPGLLPLLAAPAARCHLPVVWNTNLYCTREALAHLWGLATVYLVDLKFGPGPCAAALARAEDYWEVVTRRLLELQRRGAARIMLRHLVLPGHFDCCTRPVLEWAVANLPGVPVNVMTEYLPRPAAGPTGELGRFLTPEEDATARAFAGRLGLGTSRSFPDETQAPSDQEVPSPAADREVLELVLSPTGSVLLRHPTRAALELLRRASRLPAPQKEGIP